MKINVAMASYNARTRVAVIVASRLKKDFIDANGTMADHARNIFGLPGLSFIAESLTSARPKLVIPTRCLFIP